jgi:pimeloyl-ACP methyl ester carboxylesterase
MRAPILIGHDLGGLYALTYAIDNPGRLRALVLTNTTIYADLRVVLGLVPLLAPGFGEAYAWLAGRARYRELHRRRLASMYPEATPVETIINLTEPYGRTASWLAVLRSLRGLNPVRVLQWQREMHRLELPVLILWGEGDPYFPNAVPDRLLRDVPRAELQYISDAGHFPMLSQPDLVARALLAFAENIRSG